MAWFADLSPYTYFSGYENCLNIGWLERDHAFHRGPVLPAFAAELRRLSKDVVNQTRDLHRCQFCIPPDDPIGSLPECGQVWWAERSSSNEVHVVGETGITFAAPSLLMHYISEHQYQPPEEFIKAVLFQQRLRMERASVRQRSEVLVLDAKMEACFGGKERHIEVTIGDDTATLSLASADGADARATPLASIQIGGDQARALIASVVSVFATSQSLGAGRSTTAFTCSVRWTKDATTTEWKIRSSEPERSVILDVLPQLAEDKRALAELKYANYRNWAHDLMEVAERIIAKHRAISSLPSDRPQVNS